MPHFLTQEELYRLLQRELPDGMFPDGPPADFYHTAEMDSNALVLASAYSNASGIYQNFFPQSCDYANINAWEIKVFGQVNTQLLTLAERQALILRKLRAARGITLAIIEQVIEWTIPGLTYEVVSWCCGEGMGGWVLDVSQLDLETYLNYNVQFAGPVGPQLCSDSPSDWGMTAEQWAWLQTMAYTYEVRIYGRTLTTLERATLNNALTVAEPARSTHVINDGLDPSQMLNEVIMALNIVHKTATYQIAATDDWIVCNGTFTVTLPPGSSYGDGKELKIFNVGAGIITVAPSGADLILGVNAAQTIPNQYQEATFNWDGIQWLMS